MLGNKLRTQHRSKNTQFFAKAVDQLKNALVVWDWEEPLIKIAQEEYNSQPMYIVNVRYRLLGGLRQVDTHHVLKVLNDPVFAESANNVVSEWFREKYDVYGSYEDLPVKSWSIVVKLYP